MLEAFSFQFDTLKALEITRPLILFILAISLYSIFIFKFYKFLGKRDVLELNLAKYNQAQNPYLEKFIHVMLYFIEFILFLPIIIFFWFMVLTAILVFLSENKSPENIALIAMSLVGAVRATSYYNEDLSKDLAKLLPFALLAVFIGDLNVVALDSALPLLTQMAQLYDVLFYYMLFIILMEVVFRIVHGIRSMLSGAKADDEQGQSARRKRGEEDEE